MFEFDFTDFKEYLLTMEVTPFSAAIKLAISVSLGAIVGMERQTRRQSAGMRTFSLIAVSCTAAMLLSIWIPQSYPHFLNGDPGRIAAQILTGIGFLGAGTIIQSKGSVHGLTTAACIWVVAVTGMCVGAGMYVPAVVLTTATLFVLITFERLERRRALAGQVKYLTLFYETVNPDIDKILQLLKKHAVYVYDVSIDKNFKLHTAKLILKIQVNPKETLEQLFEVFHQEEGVTEINLNVL